MPAGVFDKSAKVALKQWEYKPRIQSGKGVRQTGLLVQLDYQLGASLDTASVEKNASPDVERIIVPPKQSKLAQNYQNTKRSVSLLLVFCLIDLVPVYCTLPLDHSSLL